MSFSLLRVLRKSTAFLLALTFAFSGSLTQIGPVHVAHAADEPITAQAMPTLTAPANGYSTSVWRALDFQWTEVPEATQYAIELCWANPDTNGEANNAAASQYRIGAAVLQGGSSTIFNGSTVGLSGTYYWRIIAIKNGQLWGTFSDAFSFTVNAPKPTLSSPDNAATIPRGLMTYSWSSVDGATGYAIELCWANPDTNGEANNAAASQYRIGAAVLGGGSATSFSGDNSDLGAQSYWWRIIAIRNGQLWGKFSNAFSFQVSAFDSLARPSLLLPSWGEVKQIRGDFPFTWTPVPGATGYAIELLSQEPAPGEECNRAPSMYRIGAAILPGGSNTTFMGSTVGLFGGYWWRIIAIRNGQLHGVFSQASYFRAEAPPTQPIGGWPNGQDVGRQRFTFSWQPVIGASYYGFELLSFNPENPNGTTASQYRIGASIVYGTSIVGDGNGLQGGQYYFWRVIAYDASGRPLDRFSDAWSFWVPPKPPEWHDVAGWGGGDVSGTRTQLIYVTNPWRVVYTIGSPWFYTWGFVYSVYDQYGNLIDFTSRFDQTGTWEEPWTGTGWMYLEFDSANCGWAVTVQQYY